MTRWLVAWLIESFECRLVYKPKKAIKVQLPVNFGTKLVQKEPEVIVDHKKFS